MSAAASRAAAPNATGGNPLWDFAVWAYDREGVAKACLALQDRCGADVNMIMFCLWLASRGQSNEEFAPYLNAAIELSRRWQRDFVQPLRDCRTNMKAYLNDGPADFKHRAAMTSLRAIASTRASICASASG